MPTISIDKSGDDKGKLKVGQTLFGNKANSVQSTPSGPPIAKQAKPQPKVSPKNKKGNCEPNKKPKSEKVESFLERAIKIEPEYREKIKSEKWKIPTFTKTDSPLYDSVTKIISIFAGLLQLPPTRKVLRWCAHKQTFLSELFEPIKKDLEFLPSRLEEKFPRCSKKISDLIDELKAAFQKHTIHLLKGPRLYLLPPESWSDFHNYEEFLRWREQEIGWAVYEDPNIESHEEAEDMVKGLTCTYPADIIKICAEIYKDLEKPYMILLEREKPEEPEQENTVKNLSKQTFAKDLAQAYIFPVERVRVELNRAANKDSFLRTEIKEPKARGPKFVYDTERAKPILDELKKKYIVKH